jgi:hypothetical protein
MTASSQPLPERKKLDEDDHDLLTFGEAGERLRMEIRATEDRLNAYLAASDSEAAEREQKRLSALRDAAQRNSAQPLNDENFARFFGYPGKARRNLPSVPGDANG